MKKLLFHALLLLFFVFSFSTLASAGGDMPVIVGKDGKTHLVINIPDEYLNQDGNPKLPIELRIVQKDGRMIFLLNTIEKEIVLPEFPKGEYLFELEIGNFQYEKKIDL